MQLRHQHKKSRSDKEKALTPKRKGFKNKAIADSNHLHTHQVKTLLDMIP